MQFQVQFRGGLPDPVSPEIGTAEVALIRQELGDVPLSVIDQKRGRSSVVDRLRKKGGDTVTVLVPEETAAALDAFQHRATAAVQVVQAVMGRFLRLEVWHDEDAQGHVTRAGVQEVLDTAALLQAWLDAGAPERWSE